MRGNKESQQRIHAHGSIHGYRHQSVPFELLHGEQEQRDEDAPFEATQEERHHYRPDKGPEHEDNRRNSDSEPDRARVTAEGEIGDGPDQATCDHTQQKPSLEALYEGVLYDLEVLDAVVSYGRRYRSRRYTAGR